MPKSAISCCEIEEKSPFCTHKQRLTLKKYILFAWNNHEHCRNNRVIGLEWTRSIFLYILRNSFKLFFERKRYCYWFEQKVCKSNKIKFAQEFFFTYYRRKIAKKGIHAVKSSLCVCVPWTGHKVAKHMAIVKPELVCNWNWINFVKGLSTFSPTVFECMHSICVCVCFVRCYF